MTMLTGRYRLMGAVLLAAVSAPALAQSSSEAEARLRKLEAEVRALQRSVFPGAGDGKVFTPQVTAPGAATAPAGTPATTPVADLLTRMEAVEAQLSRLTATTEENQNRVAQLEAKLAAQAPTPVPAATAAPVIVTPTPAPVTAATTPAPRPGAPATSTPVRPATGTAATATPKPAATTPSSGTAKPAAPSAQRLAAVRAIEKPDTGDAAEDAYSYGYRLWEAKFYPEAQQQLKLYLDQNPKDDRVSFARNLLGRAFLDDGKPREAAQWFLANYNADKAGARAPDSLLYLGVAMGRLKDTTRACIALSEFAEKYPREAAGRLKSDYAAARSAVTCP